MDRHTPEQRRKNMQAVKASGSEIEKLLCTELFKRGYRFRKNDKKVFGKPDIVFKKKKIAVFCDSEFWHGKNWKKAKKEIKTNKSFWYSKIEGNIKRDKTVNKQLKKDGWIVIRFWGKDIFKNVNKCADKFEKELIEKIKNV